MLWEDNYYLMHYGIKGQRWGLRRFQNPDGTLTDVGKKRYGNSVEEVRSNMEKAQKNAVALRRKSDDLNSRKGLYAVFTTNDIQNAHAARKAVKAEKEASKIEKVYEKMVTEEDRRSKLTEYEKRAQDATKPFSESYGKKYKDGTTTYQNDMDSLDDNPKFNSLMKYVWDKLGADHDKTYKLGKEAIESKKGVRKHPITDKAVKRSNASKEADLQFSKQFADEMEKLNKYALDYINKNFSGRERDIAKAYVYYNYLEGN